MKTTPILNEEGLKSIFRQRYQPATLRTLLDQLFPQPNKYLNQPMPLDADERKARSVVQLGTVALADGRNLAFFEVEVADSIRIQRNRQGLRDIAARYIDQSIIHAALVVYHSPNQVDYRLSLLAKTAGFTNEGEFVTTQTAPKRYTYVLGPNEPCTTAARQFLSLLAKPADLSLDDLTEAFSVERLTKDFFKRYKEHYERFWRYIAERGDYARLLLDPDESKTLVQREKPIRDFAKKLLGRLVFLQFLQKKGWMGVAASRTDWKEGDTGFVRHLYESAPDKSRFYSERLTKLFFETLNTDQPQRPNHVFAITGTKVPYLNGGLFDNEACQTNHFDFPTEYFGQLFDTFDQYNFTIDENSPDEQEVGIDPEMLGHIFENLLEENREKGTFYTPKEIVHYMCQESLIQYLRTHLPECADDQAPATRALEVFVRNGEVGDRTARHNFIVQNAPRLEELLDAVKICDPAIGSGAFPMGLLQEIFRAKLALDLTLDRAEAKKHIIQNSIYGVDIEKGAVDIARLRFWLALVVDEDEPQPLPNLDYKIMQGNSLLESFEGIRLDKLTQDQSVTYLVDNGQMDMFGQVVAPQISMHFSTQKKQELQALLRLYYDPETLKKKGLAKETVKAQIEALVHNHIEYNFELAERSLEEQSGDLKAELKIIEKAIRNNPNEPVAKRKKKENQLERLRTSLLALEAKLATVRANLQKLYDLDPTNKPYFLWHLFFKDVFDKDGFDIMIGNPPYVQLSKMPADTKALSEEGYATFEKAGDLYCMFYEQGIKLLKTGGILSYITSNSWLQTKYGESLRRYFVEQSDPLSLLNFVDTQLFETAIVETNILLTQKGTYHNRLRVAVVDASYSKGTSLAAFVDDTGYLQADLPAQGWSIGNAWESALKTHMEVIGKKLLERRISINFGIRTGYNKAFVLDLKTKENLIEEDSKTIQIIKPLIRGRDISRYKVNFDNLWILISRHLGKEELLDKYPVAAKYLRNFEEQLKARGQVKNGQHHWIELDNAPSLAYLAQYEGAKIFWGELADRAKFSYDESGFYTLDTAFIMTGESLKYLLAILNSRAAQWYFEQITTTSGMGTNRWKKYKIEQLPVPEPTPEQEQHLEILVNEILVRKKDGQDTQSLENEVDARVFALYGLSETDVQYVLDSAGDLSATDRAEIVRFWQQVKE